MIDKYEIKNDDNEEILILYLSLDYEFAIKDIFKKDKNIGEYIKEYIIKNNIAFKGKVVSLVIGGIFVGNIIINNEIKANPKVLKDERVISLVSNEIVKNINDLSLFNQIPKPKIEEKKIEEKSKKESTVKKQEKVVKKSNNVVSNTKKNTEEKKKTTEEKDNNIYISLNKNGKVIKIELEEYLIGVVGAEMPAAFHIEALKAQAIISRTYALKANSKGKTLMANESNQSYKTNSELKSLWGNNYDTYYNKIKSAVTSTKGKYLAYNGNYIEAVFHSTSNGKTESSVNVWGNSYPYLVSVASPYDNLNSSFSKSVKLSFSDLFKKLGFEVNNETSFNILSKTSGDRVKNIAIDNHNYTGVELRNLLGLRSADFTLEIEEDGVIFTTKGYGHGVGLSQYGANGYAKNGYNYEKILKHYYKGVTIKSR